jgi:hypothetical protein
MLFYLAPHQLLLLAALAFDFIVAPPILLADEFRSVEPPPDGNTLKQTGKIVTVTGLAALALVPLAYQLDRGSKSDIGPLFTLATATVAVGGLVGGPLIYSAGSYRTRKLEMWENGRLSDKDLDGDSSAANRRFRVYGLLGETNFYFPGTNGGGTLLAFLSRNELLEARYFRGNRSDISDDAIDRSQRGWFYGLLYTRFWANSFYTSAGVGYRYLNFQLNEAQEKAGIYELERKDAGVLLSLGNRWQWEYLAIGAEWAGVFIPVKTIQERRVASHEDDALEKEIKDADRYRKIMFGMLAVHAGITF